MNRREFINTLLRGGALMALLALVGVVVWKNRNAPEDCETFNACQSCQSKQSCEKPQAVEYRNGEK